MIKIVRHRYSSKKCLSNRVPDSSMTDFKWSQIPCSHKSFQGIIFQTLLHYILLKTPYSHICSPSPLFFFLTLCLLLSCPLLLLLHPSLSPILLASDLNSIFVTQKSLYVFDLVIINQYILFQFNVLCPAHPRVHRIGNWQPGKLNKKTTRLAEPQLCCPSAHTNPI